MSYRRPRLPEVALPAMNRVHEEELALLDRLAQAFEEGEEAAIDALLEEFATHLEAHFAGEEGRMERAAFPPYPVHRAEHERIREELAQVRARWRETRDAAMLARWFFEDYTRWLESHVATMDHVTAAYLAMQGID
ncbi:MAG: hypothetical protein D6721_08665 [Gammaproteobacteria bacterium]|nr:MAG: hypothetical protein D6721_08665 [Gammaproteobacteria bacterium]